MSEVTERAKALLDDAQVVSARKAEMIAELNKTIEDAKLALVALGARRVRKPREVKVRKPRKAKGTEVVA